MGRTTCISGSALPLEELVRVPCEVLERTLCGPLYYSGATDRVQVSVGGGAARICTLARDHGIDLPLQLPPRAMVWMAIE